MDQPHTLNVDRTELYRTAIEFECVATRIIETLPRRHRDTVELLRRNARVMVEQLGRKPAGRAALAPALKRALFAAETCSEQLDRLHMIRLGGFASVTTGLELLERLCAGMIGLLEDGNESAGPAGPEEDGRQQDDAEQDGGNATL